MNIVNNTVYNEEFLLEAAKVLTKKYKMIIGAAVVLFALMSIIYGVTGLASGNMTIVLIPIIGIVGVLIIGYVKVNNYKKTLLKRLQVVNHQDEVKCGYVFDDEKTVITSANGTNTLFHKDVKKISETKNLYVIIYLGGVFSIVSKNGFVEGSEADFRKVFSI